MYTQVFLIEGQCLGQASRKPERCVNYVRAPNSYTYFCQYCGRTYAMMPVVHPSGKVSEWHAIRGQCKDCESPSHFDRYYAVPGSIWQHGDGFLDALPLPVLQYEFERQLQHWEKQHGFATE